MAQDTSLPLASLPFEIRALIWEATLPPARIFHVKDTKTVGQKTIFTFHRKSPPPVALHVCAESRAAALRNGGFFLAPDPGTGPWFNPKRDILYFDRNQRHMLRIGDGRTRISGWEQVLHVGIEWRAWYRDVPRHMAPGDADIRRHWRSVIRSLCLHMPALVGIHYVLPRFRHKGGVTWGREPFKSEQYEAQLVHLPKQTKIPWAGLNLGIRNAIRNGAAAGNAAPGVLAAPRTTPGGKAMLTMTTWGDIQADMERALEEELKEGEDEQVAALDWTLAYEDSDEEEADNSKCVFPGNRVPDVVGWWLLRPDAPRQIHPSIKEFFT